MLQKEIPSNRSQVLDFVYVDKEDIKLQKTAGASIISYFLPLSCNVEVYLLSFVIISKQAVALIRANISPIHLQMPEYTPAAIVY